MLHTPSFRALLLTCLLLTVRGAETLPQAQRLVILGDSITQGGLWVDYLEACLFTRCPQRRLPIIAMGLSSETVSGLSEDGHAGGKFPRPDLHERLDRLLAQARPDCILACYGMNDGIYLPFAAERFAAFQAGMRRLRDKAAAAGATVIHMTPPVFDPKGGDKARYDEVLARYGAWLIERRADGWPVIDIHGPMSAILAACRAERPEFRLANDGVHPGPTGHLILAAQVMDAWQVPAEVDAASIDAAALAVTGGQVTGLARQGGGLAFTWTTRLPMPMEADWDPAVVRALQLVERHNRQRLVISGLAAGRWDVQEDGHAIATVTAAELGAGLDCVSHPGLSSNRRSRELAVLVHQRRALLGDAWRSAVGHKRPGVAKGLPVEEAERKAEELEKRIRALVDGGVALSLRVVPAAP